MNTPLTSMTNPSTPHREGRHQMTLRMPASRWQDALPLGNGLHGAMVHGNIARETILINHTRLWWGSTVKPLIDLSPRLPELRRMLAEGRYLEAEHFFPNLLKEAGQISGIDSFRPGPDLIVEMPTRMAFSAYERRLDFASGVATVAWKEGDLVLVRETFVSQTDDVVVLSIRASQPGAIRATLSLTPHDLFDCFTLFGRNAEMNVEFQTEVDGEYLTLIGRRPDGKCFGAVARVVTCGGQSQVVEGKINVADADEILVLAQMFTDGEAQEQLTCLRRELGGIAPDYDDLLARHATCHKEIFGRLDLDLGAASHHEAVNEQILLDGYCGDVPTALTEKMFDLGRYLLIASSSPKGFPSNIQGLWNGDHEPPWFSPLFTNENVQMTYWSSLPGNLIETVLPVFDLYLSLMDDFRENAQEFFGCRGILLPIYHSPYDGRKWDTQPHIVYCVCGGGWISQIFFDYWLYTGDRTFLAEKAVPFMKEVALFYEDYLFENEEGYYVFSPSVSPENNPNGDFEGGGKISVSVNATIDFAITKELLTNLCTACEELGIEQEGVARWHKMLTKIPPYQINEDGALREWMHPDFKDNYKHRHESHLYPLFPGIEITEETDLVLYEACRVAVEKRMTVGLGDQSGWSFTHMANVQARLGQGDRALEALELMSRTCLGQNFLAYHNDWRRQGMTVNWLFSAKGAAYQADANFGWTAAILEMLAYSRPGMIKLLPALPDKWRTGRCDGILCRGQIELSVAWNQDERIIDAQLISSKDQTITIHFPGAIEKLETTMAEGCVKDSPYGSAYRQLVLSAGQKVMIGAKLVKE